MDCYALNSSLINNGYKIVSRGKNLRIYDSKTGRQIDHIPHYVYAVDNDLKYYTSQEPEEGPIQLRQLDNQKLVKEFPGFSNRVYPYPDYLARKDAEWREKILTEFKRTRSMVFSPDGQYLAACSLSELMVRIWKVKSGELVIELDVRNDKSIKKNTRRMDCSQLITSSDSKYLLVDARDSNYGSGILLEFKTGDVIGEFGSGYGTTAFAVGNGGRNLIQADSQGQITIWDIEENTKIKTIYSGSSQTEDVAMSPNGQRIAIVAGLDLKIFDAKGGKILKKLTGHEDRLGSVSFSPDGQYLVSAEHTGQIKLWDVSEASLAAKAKDTRQEGIVHKNESYWNLFGTNSVVEKVFNGEFDGLNRNVKFKVYYRDYLVAYSDICKNDLLPGAEQRGLISQTVHIDEWGNERWREAPTVRKIFIEPKFLAKYDEYSNDSEEYKNSQTIGSVFKMLGSLDKNIQRNGVVAALTDSVKSSLSSDTNWQMLKFNKKAKCGSATMTQMRENFWRASQGMASVQKDKVKIKNAQRESVAFEDVLPKRAFYQGCIARLNTYDQRGVNYCSCMEISAKQVMTDKEYSYFSKDFSRYYIEVTDNLSGKPSTDRVWELNKVRNNCVQ